MGVAKIVTSFVTAASVVIPLPDTEICAILAEAAYHVPTLTQPASTWVVLTLRIVPLLNTVYRGPWASPGAAFREGHYQWIIMTERTSWKPQIISLKKIQNMHCEECGSLVVEEKKMTSCFSPIRIRIFGSFRFIRWLHNANNKVRPLLSNMS